jgi:hypothetical protein
MEALRGLSSTGTGRREGLELYYSRSGVTENGAKDGVRRGRRGGEAGTGSVEVSGKGAGQIKAKELGSPLSRCAGMVGGAIPMAGAGAAKGFVGGGEEAEEISTEMPSRKTITVSSYYKVRPVEVKKGFVSLAFVLTVQAECCVTHKNR